MEDRGPNAPDGRGGWDGPWPAGWTVEHVAETGSTNADLLATATERPDRSVLVADHQTAGRGRLDRRWEAPPGANLLVSLLFRDVPSDPSELTRRVGLAAVDACRDLTGVEAVLKWPNDVLTVERQLASGTVERQLATNAVERKLAGILAERGAAGHVVVGLGLNVGWCPDGAARLGTAAADGTITPAVVLRALLAAYDRLPADTFERYRAALGTLGRRVRIELPTGVLEGTAVDVEPDGRLVVVDTCAVTHRLSAGDVVHLRGA